MQISFKNMLIYKIIFLLIHIFYGRGLKGRDGCRQTEVHTDRQTNSLKLPGGRERQFRCLLFWCRLRLWPLGRRPRYLCVHAIMGVA